MVLGQKKIERLRIVYRESVFFWAVGFLFFTPLLKQLPKYSQGLRFITSFYYLIFTSNHRKLLSKQLFQKWKKSHQDKELWKIQVKTLKTPAKMANFQQISRILLASNFTEKMIFSHVFLSRIKIKDFTKYLRRRVFSLHFNISFVLMIQQKKTKKNVVEEF